MNQGFILLKQISAINTLIHHHELWWYCTHLPRRPCQWRSSDEIWCM